MTDIPNPAVYIAFACGCTWLDTTPLDGITPHGDTKKLKKDVGFSFNDGRALEQKPVPRKAIEVGDDAGKAGKAKTIVFPEAPTQCPRHGQPAFHVHASYLNPADPPPAPPPPPPEPEPHPEFWIDPETGEHWPWNDPRNPDHTEEIP